MLSKQEEEQERRETLENDLRVLRERGSTFHQTGEPIPPHGFRNKRKWVSAKQKSLVNLNLGDRRSKSDQFSG